MEEKMKLNTTEDEQIIEMDIDRLHDFKNHPFREDADDSMLELKESIEKYGVQNYLKKYFMKRRI